MLLSFLFLIIQFFFLSVDFILYIDNLRMAIIEFILIFDFQVEFLVFYSFLG